VLIVNFHWFMSRGAHTIKAGTGTRATKKRLGRGNASKGTYSGRGIKGQRSRSGGKGGGQRRGFKANLQKVPKLRGFKSLNVKPETVTLARLSEMCENGEAVTAFTLHKKGLISKPQYGAKIVATGTLDKKLNLKGVHATKGATLAIEKAGGTLSF